MNTSPTAAQLTPLDPLVLRLSSLLQQRSDLVVPRPSSAVRAAVHRQAASLRRRRRRLRHAVGSGTLLVGVAAGGVEQWLVSGGSPTGLPTAEGAEPTSDAAAAPGVATPRAPLPPPETAKLGWTWDAGAGLARDAADPGVLHDGDRFHVYATSAGHCTAAGCDHYFVPRFESDALDRPGRLAGDAMPQRPTWVAPDDREVWAPAAARVDARVVLWFAATSGRPGDRGAKCIGAAVAATPDGPFVPEPAPIHCTPGHWAIDPTPVLGDDGLTLLWRQDDLDHPVGTISSAPLWPEGLALAGPPTRLIEGEQPWEDGYPDRPDGIGPIENPAMARHPATGEWLLTWSANRWETRDYATGLAICER